MRYIEYRERIDEQPDGCWLWTGKVNRDGYGLHSVGGGRFRMAHRVVYEDHKGAIPDGMTLDHLCRVRRCVNPEHLEPTTHRENVLRSDAVTAINARKTECLRGHPFDEVNTYLKRDGGRECRTCKRIRRAA